MKAIEYLGTFPTQCVFHAATADAGPSSDQPCDLVAVAVYVTADHLHIAKYVCERHARAAERSGDGPVFWIDGHQPAMVDGTLPVVRPIKTIDLPVVLSVEDYILKGMKAANQWTDDSQLIDWAANQLGLALHEMMPDMGVDSGCLWLHQPKD